MTRISCDMDPLRRWQIAIPILLIISFVIAIISYLFYKIIKSHRKTTDSQQRIYHSAILFMAFNWLTAIGVFAINSHNLGVYVFQGDVWKTIPSLISVPLLLLTGSEVVHFLTEHPSPWHNRRRREGIHSIPSLGRLLRTFVSDSKLSAAHCPVHSLARPLRIGSGPDV